MQSDSNILQIDNLSKYFGGLAAVFNCSIKIKKGSITELLVLMALERQLYLT